MSLKLEDSIILRSDIPEFLTQRGIELHSTKNGYRCRCPIHNGESEDTFSCTSKKWYCFKECIGGTIIELYMALENVTYIRALADLANMYDIDLSNNEEYTRAKSYFEEKHSLIRGYQRNVDQA